MRIAHVTATFPPYQSGTGNVCFHNARALARLGHDVHVYTAEATGNLSRKRLDGIEVHRLKTRFQYGNARFIPGLYKHLKGFDLVHVHMPFYGGAETIYLLKASRKIPLVITHHQDVQLQGPAKLISRAHDRLFGRRLMQLAERACFTSLDYAYHSQYAEMIARGRIKPVELPNGVDPDHFTVGRPPTRLLDKYKLQGRQVALFVGALDRAHYFKGVGMLLRALNRPDLSDLALVIVGRGDLRASYEREVDQLALNDRVHFAGYVTGEELPDYYRLADVTVLPSTTAGEAFGLVLLESMACGTPVIASNLPGVRTVVAPETDGFLAQPSDEDDLAAKLKALFSLSPARRRAMGLAGRRKVESRYAWSKIGDLLEGMYSQILEQRHPALEHKTRAAAG